MYSNSAGTTNEIRMGFFDSETGQIFGSDGTTLLGNNKVSFDKFGVLLEPETGKSQRLFDVAVTPKDDIRFLYCSFTVKKNINDSIYYLYDNETSTEICAGGKALWDPKYQLGASFVGNNMIVVGKNDCDVDFIELYDYADNIVTFNKVVHQENNNNDTIRNARPISDLNGKIILWHNGYYNSNSYTNYSTNACLYSVYENLIINCTK